ncbi:MAG TPA: glycoside hydrolase family 140 protein [Bryobacteraceae bacterium]|nr:glycoside hydrolase family 140 protein [Bryobacteraceae bacterium]
MRQSLKIAFAALLTALPALTAAPHGDIVVSPNRHFLQYQDGTPFFWLGDTAWLLFTKLDRAQTETYLDDRASKGFNVIQVMVINSPNMKSVYGVLALNNGDPGKPNVTPGNDLSKPGEYDYWDHVDWVVDQAAKRGIFVALVPAWGSQVKSGALNLGNAAAYGTFLAKRYGPKPNIFWIVGGDIQGDNHEEVWNLLGSTLKAQDHHHLITYHPIGRTQSSMWFQNASWLDFNMFQSGHRRYDQDTDSVHRYGEDNWRYALADWALKPTKPVLDGEPSYENIPQGLHDGKQPYWQAQDVRRYGYWSVFGGSCGHTYGDNAIMQFHRPGDGRGAFFVRNYWFEAIHDPGSGQMQFLKKLMLSRPYFSRVPDEDVIAPPNGTRYDYVIATRGDGYIFAYTYTGKPFHVHMGVLSGAQLHGWWYSPSDGSSKDLGMVANSGEHTFTPPGTPEPGNDWVLVLDQPSKHFPAPGK